MNNPLFKMVNGVQVQLSKEEATALRAQWAEAQAVPVAAPVLSPAQWSFFLDLTGFGAVIDATLSAMPKTTVEERTAWAALKAVAYNSPEYSLAATIALAAQFGGDSAPSQDEIEQAWGIAAQFQGAASLMGAP